MKNDIQELARVISSHKSFAIFTHKNPDGDAVGGVCAFSRMLKLMGKCADCFVQLPLKDAVNVNEETKNFSSSFADTGYDCFVAIDCGSLDHLYLGESIPKGKELLVVDHHYTNTFYGTLNYVKSQASSVGEVIFEIIEALGVSFDEEISKALYLSIVSDTWYFSFANTTPKSLRMVASLLEGGLDFMALNEVIKAKSLEKFSLMQLALANSTVVLGGKGIFMFIPGSHEGEDTEGVVDSARNVKGCLFAALCTQVGESSHKVSLRSNTDLVDVSSLASRFGGGGHKRASGFTFTGEGDELKILLEDFLRECLHV